MKASAFGDWLKLRRKGLDLTQVQLAGRIVCAVSTLQKIEAGDRQPSREFAGRIAEVLKVEPDKRSAFVAFARGSQDFQIQELFLPPSNLPVPTTPLIGRKVEIEEICKRLLADDTRLVTLVGPPGVGKTRLSLHVASELRENFDNGAYFISLADITDPELLASTIAGAIGLKESGHRAPFDHLCGYLRFKLLLLVLDNFEQIVSASAQVAELLHSCLRLKILVTSRIPLRVRAERQYPVAPLRTPEPSHLPPLDRLARYEAIALFADRAGAVAHDFSISNDNASAVANICHRLDGLPLAIEIISAHIKILQPSELLARLDRSLLLSSDGLRDLEERQHTLNNAIEWSYSLLSVLERLLFNRLGAFVGGWTLEDMEAICQTTASRTETPTHQLLLSLIDKSLVLKQDFNGKSRFTLLKTIQEFVVNKLKDSGEYDEIHIRHAEHYLSLLERLGPQLKYSVRKVNQIELEHDNLREALSWSFLSGHNDLAIRLVLALTSLWEVHTWHLSEGRKWIDRVLAAARTSQSTPHSLARLYQEAGVLAYLQGDYESSRGMHQQALSLARNLNDNTLIADALFGISNAAMNQGNYDEVLNLLEECLPLARSAGENWLEAMALNNLAEVARIRGNFEQAEQLFKEGSDILAGIGDRLFRAILLDGLGTIAQYRGDYDKAQDLHYQSLVLSRDMDDRRVIAMVLEKTAGVAAGQLLYEKAARLLGAAEALREAIQTPVENIDRGDYDRIVTMTKAGLEDDVLSEIWAKGRSMTLSEAIACALENYSVE